MNAACCAPWEQSLNAYHYPVDFRKFSGAAGYQPGFFNQVIAGDRASTKAFERRFRKLAPRKIEAWAEVAFWKVYSQPGRRHRTTERIIGCLGGRDPREIWEACLAYIEAPARETFGRFRALFGLRSQSIAVVATFPAFVDPERFPMVDTRTARWVKENHTRHNTADPSAPRLVPPARYLRVSHATVLTLADFDFVGAWTAWCRYTAAKLSAHTGHHWGARDVEMAVFQAARTNTPLPAC